MRKTVKFEIVSILFFFLALVVGQSCGPAGRQENTSITAEPAASQTETASSEEPAEIDPTLIGRLRNEKWKGDLDGLVARRYIRALVLYNKTNFFYDGPQPR